MVRPSYTWRIQYWCNSSNTERTMHLNSETYDHAIEMFDEVHPNDRRLHIFKEHNNDNEDW